MTARVTGGAPRRSATAANRSAIRASRAASGPPAAAAPFQPLSFAKRPADAPRVVLFDVDGVEYTVPAVVETGTALALLAVLRGIPDERMAGMRLISELCSPGAVAALLSEASFTADDWGRLVKTLWQHAFGALEQEEGDGQGN